MSHSIRSLARACAVMALLASGCGVDRGGGGFAGGGGGALPDLGSGGSCAHCATGQGCCGAKCIDLTVDAKNCGMCGHACAAGETCKGSVCSCFGAGHCPMGQACCMGGCKTLTTDAENCGTCGNGCEAQNPGETCFQGKCGCGTGDTHCMGGQLCCSNACGDVMADPMNCGTCGNACPNGQTCTNGACSGGMMGGGNCMPACQPGEMCVMLQGMSVCVPGMMGGGGNCMTDMDCMNGMKCLLLGQLPCIKGLPFPCMCK